MPLRFKLDFRSLKPFFNRLVACHNTVLEFLPACSSVLDASHSRQPLVKGERLVRYEVNAGLGPYAL